MAINIRRARFPADFNGMVGVYNATLPDWPVTAEELERRELDRDRSFHRAVFVAETTTPAQGQLVGLATVAHEPAAHRSGKFRLQIEVRPREQGHGLGSGLYRAVLDHLAPLEVRELFTVVSDDNRRGIRFAQERGFAEVWQRIESRLDHSNFDPRPFSGLADRIQALGLQVKTYAGLNDDPRRLEKLYELDWLLYRDMPTGEAVTKISLAEFEREWVAAPDFIPQACFIALKGSDFIGYSNLHRGHDYYLSGMTGVIGAYRGIGLATLLKLKTVTYAREHGRLEIRAVNDGGNGAMLALNKKLGFKQHRTSLRFVKYL